MPYLSLYGKSIYDVYFPNDGCLLLKNGMLLSFDDGYVNSGVVKKIRIGVDINGAHEGPNRLGYDVFEYELTQNDGELLPEGHPASTITKECSMQNNGGTGFNCTYEAHRNTDYFKKVVKNIKASGNTTW
jgi:hypothetical protein